MTTVAHLKGIIHSLESYHQDLKAKIVSKEKELHSLIERLAQSGPHKREELSCGGGVRRLSITKEIDPVTTASVAQLSRPVGCRPQTTAITSHSPLDKIMDRFERLQQHDLHLQKHFTPSNLSPGAQSLTVNTKGPLTRQSFSSLLDSISPIERIQSAEDVSHPGGDTTSKRVRFSSKSPCITSVSRESSSPSSEEVVLFRPATEPMEKVHHRVKTDIINTQNDVLQSISEIRSSLLSSRTTTNTTVSSVSRDQEEEDAATPTRSVVIQGGGDALKRNHLSGVGDPFAGCLSSPIYLKRKSSPANPPPSAPAAKPSRTTVKKSSCSVPTRPPVKRVRLCDRIPSVTPFGEANCAPHTARTDSLDIVLASGRTQYF